MACRSSLEASPSCTLLIIASSATRSCSALKRRWVSSKRRAFSRAVPRDAETVVSRRSSDSPKAFSRSKLSSPIPPRTLSLLIMGTSIDDLDAFVPGKGIMAFSFSNSATVFMTMGCRVFVILSKIPPERGGCGSTVIR